MENYAAIKARLLEHTDKSGLVVVGVDDSNSAAIYTRLAAAAPCEAVAVSVGKVLGRGIFVIDGKLYDAWGQSSSADLRSQCCCESAGRAQLAERGIGLCSGETFGARPPRYR